MKITRRKLIETGGRSAISLGAINLTSKNCHLKGDPDVLPDSYIFPFALKAVDAAIAEGASYADVRIIRTVSQSLIFKAETLGMIMPSDRDAIGFGVRVLVNGSFGFAASPYIDLEEATVLARTAVEQARENSNIRPRNLDWEKVPAQKGRWVSLGEDPFLVPFEERAEFINAWRQEVKEYRDGLNSTTLLDSSASFSRTEKFIVTSDGTAVSQVIYVTGGGLNFVAVPRFSTPLSGPHVGSVSGIAVQQGGWEVFKNADPRKQIPQIVSDSAENSRIGVGTFDVGRYDLVLDGNFVGKLVSNTFGRSTQLDFARGYEANAGGTSYLGPNIDKFLGTYVAHPGVSIKCDRTGLSKLSTVKWDDEGIVPRDFELIQDGLLINYQASRENSAKLTNSLYKHDLSFQGCANAQSGLDIPMQATPNMVMASNTSPSSLTDIISEIKRGYVVYGGDVSTTFAVTEGSGAPGVAREVRDGKLGDFIPEFQIVFSTREIWKNIMRIGDPSTVRRSQGNLSKGEPLQRYTYSVDAPAISVKDVPLIDPMRKA